MRILLLRTWEVNIGNGFIEKGAKSVLERAFPEAEVTEVSAFSGLIEDYRSRKRLFALNELFGDRINSDIIQSVKDKINIATSPFNNKDKSSSNVNIAELMDADIAVLPGCILTQQVLEIYGEVLADLADRNIPVLLLGAGGGNYRKQTQQYVDNQLEKYNIDAIITRDTTAYNCYSDSVTHSYDGIDCAFYINDWYSPPPANEQFVVSTFDKREEPTIETEYRIIRPDHEPYDDPHRGALYRLATKYKNINKNNVLMSDLLEDYLFLYANCKMTISDRIHACVPTLVYGNEARFSHETPRSHLFDRLFERDVVGETVNLDETAIEKEREKQVMECEKFIKEIL